MIGHGKLSLRDGTEHTNRPELTPQDRDAVRAWLDIPGALFVGHAKDAEIFTGDTTRLLQVAADAGFRQEMVSSISDRAGRPTLEMYRFVKTAP